ncbi:MAG: hypothetical protein ACYTG0_34650 [Planctomycetota bacterium]
MFDEKGERVRGLNDLHRTTNPEWATQVRGWLNDLCGYRGALSVNEFKKKHLRTWLQQHDTWNNNTQRNVIGAVIAAFNFCCKFEELDVNPAAARKKPAAILFISRNATTRVLWGNEPN